MNNFLRAKQRLRLVIHRILSSFITFIFAVNLFLPPVFAQTISKPYVTLTQTFTPVTIRGINLYPDNPLKFDFIVDRGDAHLSDGAFREETNKLVKYFMASLTVPESEMWVNLSPTEKNRVVGEHFGQTEMGRDLLTQDYLLKQLTASLMNPDGEIGAKFWKQVYAKAKQLGISDVPIDAFSRVWIIPEKATIYEHKKGAFVVRSHLKVMMEEDYVAMKNSPSPSLEKEGREIISFTAKEEREQLFPSSLKRGLGGVNLTADLIRQIIVPEIEREVNEGRSFDNLRQVYNSFILAMWFKNNLKQSLLGQIYVDKNKISSLKNVDKDVNQKIYNQYLEAFKKGAYEYIKEDYDVETQAVVSHRYFSGGAQLVGDMAMTSNQNEVKSAVEELQEAAIVTVSVGGETDEAMAASENDFETLIAAATTQDELKRIYRKMAKTFHPDIIRDENEKGAAAEIFKRLSNVIQAKLESAFDVRPASKTATTSKGTDKAEDWLEVWSYTAWSNAGQAEDALKKRARDIKKRGEAKIKSVTALVSHGIATLTVKDLSDLLDIVSKAEFAKKLLELTARGALTTEAITDDMIWQARPMIEKIYAARILTKGELVHFRKGDTIIRTAVLEPITKTNAILKVITVTESEDFQVIDITQQQLLDPNYDLEREPLQTGYPMNIGEVFEEDFSDMKDTLLKGKTTFTIYGVAWGGFACVAHDVIHNNKKIMGGRGFGMGRGYAEELLREGKIRRVTPLRLGEQEEASEQLSAVTGAPQKALTAAERFEPDVDVSTQPLVQFYLGLRGDHRDRKIEDMWGYDHTTLEDEHDLIQLLFPLYELGLFFVIWVRDAPNEKIVWPQYEVKDVEIWKGNTKTGRRLRANMLHSLETMLNFYGFRFNFDNPDNVTIDSGRNFEDRRQNWLTEGNHNFMRIDRILNSLKFVGLEKYSLAFFRALSRVHDQYGEIIDASDSFSYWQKSVSGIETEKLTLAEHEANLAGDAAMTSNPSQKTGGIDFNPATLNMEVQKNGNGVVIPRFDGNIPALDLDNFFPTIVKVSPAIDFYQLLNLKK